MRIVFLFAAIFFFQSNLNVYGCSPAQQMAGDPACLTAWDDPYFTGGYTSSTINPYDLLYLNSGLNSSGYCATCGVNVYNPESNWKDVFGAGLQALPQALGAYFQYKASKEQTQFMAQTAQYQFQYMENTTDRYYDACTSLGLVCEAPFGGGGGYGMGQFGGQINGAVCHGAPATCGGNFSPGYMGATMPYGPTFGGGGPGVFGGGSGGGIPGCACIQAAGCPCAPAGGNGFPGGGPGGVPGMPCAGGACGGAFPPGGNVFGPPMANVFGGPSSGMGCPGRPGCGGTMYPSFPNTQMPAVPPFGGNPNGAGFNQRPPWMMPNPSMVNGNMCGLQNYNPCANPLLNGGIDPRLAQLLRAQQMGSAGGSMDPTSRLLLQSGLGNMGGINPNISSAYAQQLAMRAKEQEMLLETAKQRLELEAKAKEAELAKLRLIQEQIAKDAAKKREAQELAEKLRSEIGPLLEQYQQALREANSLSGEYSTLTGAPPMDPSLILGIDARMRELNK